MLCGLNPALKCRAIVIASLRDGQTPNAPTVHPKMNPGKEALTISNFELRIAESATSPFRRSGIREKAAI